MKVIGITGGIASGKSFVAKFLRDSGYLVFCADEIVSKSQQKNEIGYRKIIEFFPNIMDEGGEIDRKRLGNLIFKDESKRILLNSLIHPIVKNILREEIEVARKAKIALVFIVVPLLFEAKFEDLCDIIWTVYCDLGTQTNRLMERDQISKRYALQKIRAQMSLEEKVKLSDYVINNSFQSDVTVQEIKKILNEVKSDGL